MRLIHFESRRGLVFEQIDQELGLPHVFAAKAVDGSGNLSLSGGRNREKTLAERDCWSRYLKVSGQDWVVGGQSHGAHVQVVDHSFRGRGARRPETVLPNTDGLLTTECDLPLYVAGADCSTVLLVAASATPAIAVVHAGWRGAAKGIISVAIEKLIQASQCEAHAIYAGVSPCIGLENFEVGEEVATHVPASQKKLLQGRWHVDLAGWVAAQILQSGVDPQKLEVAEMDTVKMNHLFFSHRGEGGETGRMGLIAKLPNPK